MTNGMPEGNPTNAERRHKRRREEGEERCERSRMEELKKKAKRF